MEPGYHWVGWKPPSLDRRVASVRIRCFNPMAKLQSLGFPVERFDPRHVASYKAAVYSKRYDDASFHEAFTLKKKGVRIFFDLCDNHFYNPQGSPYWKEAGEKLRRMISLADYLVTSTETMANVLRSELPVPRPITVIGDAVEEEISGLDISPWQRWYHQRQLSRLLRQLKTEQDQGFTPLIWFGNHGVPYADGGMLDLLQIRPILEGCHRHQPLSLTVISNSRLKYREVVRPWSLSTHYLEWHPDTFLPALKAHTIAVIPITPNPFTVCKSNNRLALSLYHGLAVVADAIPSYQSFQEVCILDDWETGLRRYLSDPPLRKRHVYDGQEMIAREWSLSYIAQKWQDLFSSI